MFQIRLQSVYKTSAARVIDVSPDKVCALFDGRDLECTECDGTASISLTPRTCRPSARAIRGREAACFGTLLRRPGDAGNRAAGAGALTLGFAAGNVRHQRLEAAVAFIATETDGPPRPQAIRRILCGWLAERGLLNGHPRAGA